MRRVARGAEPEAVAGLKRRLRMTIAAAVRDGDIEGVDALDVVVSVAAEMVALVDDDRRRRDMTEDVSRIFPDMVTVIREIPPGASIQ